MREQFIVILALALVCTAQGTGTGAAESPFVFTGTVLRGEDLRMEIPEGLVFALDFIDYGPEGWSVRVFDPARPSDNFCAVVTPPYRGMNALQIFAWHFFNEGRNGPNDGSVNAPGEERHFSFVTDTATYDRAFTLLSSMLWPDAPEEAEEAAGEHELIPREEGRLVIEELETGSVPGTDSVWIERMEVTVELFIP